MSLLELRHVRKRYGRRTHERVVLEDVSLEVQAGELVSVWGMRRSGRSTLLRIAAGVEAPDAGIVLFDGHDLAGRCGEALGGGIGFCRTMFRPSEGDVVLDHLVLGQCARNIAPSLAVVRATAALERVDAAHCAALKPNELDCGEAVRVAIARALALQPRLLLIDEPTIGVDLLARDQILSLLQSFAKEGIAVLISTGESTGLSGARALTLSEGELRGKAARGLAAVVPLRRPA